MAKIKFNPILEKIRGKIGNLVFRRYLDKVVIARTADTDGRTPMPGQAAHRERFKLAVQYGRSVVSNPEVKAIYERAAKAQGIPIIALTVGDYLNAPTVEQIDLSGYTGKAGETIRIRATDDFEVVGVEARVTDSTGAVLEQGPAIPAAGALDWTYTTTTALAKGERVTVEVTATDRPGHKTSETKVQM